MARLPNQNMAPGVPAKPPGLSKTAVHEWNVLVQELADSNIQVSKAHGRLIEQAVNIMADLKDARETVTTEGAYISNEKTGVMQLHPAARRIDSLRRDYVKVLSLLGLRSAVVGQADDKSQSLEDMLDE